jgi:hypothetical protein
MHTISMDDTENFGYYSEDIDINMNKKKFIGNK